ncbi:MAG: accessory factor UbiK family protein [Endozoicomonadaceae bacterium]|nr:accessory factor UbiK family protein [Endozoicomonadaceae bacterium]
MIDKTAFITSIAGKFNTLLAGEKGPIKDDLEKHTKAILHSAFSKMELLTRDEFDAQVAVLQRTREMLEALEARVTELENALASIATSSTTLTDGDA